MLCSAASMSDGDARLNSSARSTWSTLCPCHVTSIAGTIKPRPRLHVKYRCPSTYIAERGKMCVGGSEKRREEVGLKKRDAEYSLELTEILKRCVAHQEKGARNKQGQKLADGPSTKVLQPNHENPTFNSICKTHPHTLHSAALTRAWKTNVTYNAIVALWIGVSHFNADVRACPKMARPNIHNNAHRTMTQHARVYTKRVKHRSERRCGMATTRVGALVRATCSCPTQTCGS